MTQAQALAIMKTGLNIYLTGSAGSGKTYTLREYIKWLNDHEIPVAITASTGIAATHMNGQTIHGWAGIGVREFLTDGDMDEIEQKQYLWKRFEKTKVLIIDEVSMLHAHRLDMVDRVCRRFKRNEAPFGGMQVILSGDFFQLPPVTKSGAGRRPAPQPQSELFINYDSGEAEEENSKSDLIINSRAWRAMKPAICYLTEQHRQDDSDFLEILNAIRDNKLKQKHLEIINQRLNAEIPNVPPTKLYTHNVDVDAINMAELAKLPNDAKEFIMYGKGNDALVAALKKSCLAQENLFLKPGAEVMFIKNKVDEGYVNGTRGTVIGFDYRGEPVVEIYATGRRLTVSADEWRVEEDGKVKAAITQYPLRLAWAITIHKSQGMSLDTAEIDLSKTFAYGMGYVALSRVRTLGGVRLVGFKKESLEVDPEVLKLDTKLQEESRDNEKLFGKLPKKELEQMQTEFILRSGGKIFAEPKIPKEKKSKKGKKEPSAEWLAKMEKKRAEFPNAGKRWTKDEDESLIKLFEHKKTAKQISKELGRNENSITMRLVHHGLVEPDEEMKEFMSRQKEKNK